MEFATSLYLFKSCVNGLSLQRDDRTRSPEEDRGEQRRAVEVDDV